MREESIFGILLHFLCENVKYLGIIIGETGIMCDKTMEWEKLFEQKHFKKI